MDATATKEKQYWALIAVAYVIATSIMVINGSLGTSAVSIGRLLGVGIGLALIPLLFMRFLSNRAGWIALALCGLGYSQGELNWLGERREATSTASTSNRPPAVKHIGKSCEFSVEFPQKPSVKVYTSLEFGDYDEALWVNQTNEDSAVLRTDCIKVPELGRKLDEIGPKQFLLNQLSSYAHSNGLSSVEYQYSENELGHTGFARGIKNVQGTPVTYRVMVVAGENSIISLYAGGKSSTFPQREVTPFFSSVRREP